jgi:hypothetical protein
MVLAAPGPLLTPPPHSSPPKTPPVLLRPNSTPNGDPTPLRAGGRSRRRRRRGTGGRTGHGPSRTRCDTDTPCSRKLISNCFPVLPPPAPAPPPPPSQHPLIPQADLSTACMWNAAPNFQQSRPAAPPKSHSSSLPPGNLDTKDNHK